MGRWGELDFTFFSAPEAPLPLEPPCPSAPPAPLSYKGYKQYVFLPRFLAVYNASSAIAIRESKL